MAIDCFVTGWNRTAAHPLDAGSFRRSLRAAWVTYKVFELEEWVRRWSDGDQPDELRRLIPSAAQDVLALLQDDDWA